MSDGLRMSWPELGREWIIPWAIELGRDLRLATESLQAASEVGAGSEGAAHVETALWRLAAGREKLHAVIALALGVDALRLLKSRKGILRFDPDRRANRKHLRRLASEHPTAHEVLALDAALEQHRFLSLRHQMAHSLAPVLEWRSLMWFEVAEVKRGGVIAYGARHLEPAHELQGAIPRDELFDRTVSDGHEAIQMLTESVEKLAELLGTVAVLAPPPILWRAWETDELFLEREAASQASRQASGLPPPLGWRANSGS